ncbi:Chromosome transmission fidelity protein 8 [Chytriomyces hyalinus]|nr:Chromosome transmission fidelity protein 8 [Chytriomyces hyalinus]
MSAAILATVSYAKCKQVIFSRLDGILVLLLAASLLWGAGTLIFETVFVSNLDVFMDPDSWSNKVSSLFLNVSFLLQFTTHLMLAMERLFIMGRSRTMFRPLLLVAVSVPLFILIGISLGFRSLEGTPLDPFPIKLWTVTMAAVHVACITGIIVLYAQTYSTSNTLLKAAVNAKLKPIHETGESGDAGYKVNPFAMEMVRLRVQCKILFTCIIMSSALIVSYAGYMMFMVWYAWWYSGSDTEQDPAVYAAFQMTGSVLMALDTENRNKMPQIEISSACDGGTGLLANDKDTKAASESNGEIESRWSLIEVQGVIEGVAPGVRMGTVSFDEKNTPWLQVGRHRLRGKRVKLDKPYGVMQRSDNNIVALLRVKYLFSERPVLILDDSNVGLPGLSRRK